MPLRVLFVTRSLQSSHGGMQTYTRTVIEGLKKRKEIGLKVVGYTGEKIGLPLFFLRALLACLIFRGNQIHLGDAVLSPLLPVLKVFRPDIFRSITVFGLDLKYRPKWYQRTLAFCLPFADKVVAISRAVAEEAVNHGARAERIETIPCPVPDGSREPVSRKKIDTTKPVFLIFGRQIKRKGARWFIKEVFPEVLKKVPLAKLIVAGDGPELPFIKESARAFTEKNIEVHVKVDHELKKKLFGMTDIFLMPGITVENDMEGFGITCLEAAMYGCPIVASCLEGIRDAVLSGETGFFFEPNNPNSAIETIEKALHFPWNSEKIREACLKSFDQEKIIDRYLKEVFGAK